MIAWRSCGGGLRTERRASNRINRHVIDLCAALLAGSPWSEDSVGPDGSAPGIVVLSKPSTFADSSYKHDVFGAVALQPAVSFTGAVEWDFGSGPRIEGEVGCRRLDTEGPIDISVSGPVADSDIDVIPMEGRIKTASSMSNGYYTVGTGGVRFRPPVPSFTRPALLAAVRERPAPPLAAIAAYACPPLNRAADTALGRHATTRRPTARASYRQELTARVLYGRRKIQSGRHA